PPQSHAGKQPLGYFPADVHPTSSAYPVASGFSFGGIDVSGRGNDFTSWVATGTGGATTGTSGGSARPAINVSSSSLSSASRPSSAWAIRSRTALCSVSTPRARP